MSLINRTDTFRGSVVDHEIGESPGGWPQWIASLLATQIYDVENGEWVDFSEVAENEITAWLVLLGEKGATRNVAQLEKAVGWDGVNIIELGEMDLSEITVQFRVEENTYQGKTTLRVNWIDASDATPGRSVQKLDPSELNKLQAAYARASGKKKKVKPAKAKASPKAPPKAPPSAMLPPQLQTPEPKADPVGKCTKAEAWGEVCKGTEAGRVDGKITDAERDNTWLVTVQKHAMNNDPDTISPEGWYQVKVDVLDALDVIPF